MTAVPGMGTANYGTKRVANWKLKDGDNGPYRHLPPMNAGVEAERWSSYHRIHWGYEVPDARNPAGKPRPRTFECVKVMDWDTKTVSVVCAKCDEIEEKKQLLASRLAELKEQKKSRDEIKAILKPLTDWLQKFNTEAKHYIYSMNQAGEFGILAIPHKAKMALDAKIKVLQKKKIDPTAPDQGVWFTYSRVGNGNDTTHTVEVVTDDLGDGTSRIRLAPLSEDVCRKAVAVFPKDITKLQLRITPEQVKKLVDSNGSPEEVGAIFALTQQERSPSAAAGRPTPPVEAYENDPGLVATQPTQTLPAQPAAEPAKVSVTMTNDIHGGPSIPIDAEEAELIRQLAAKRAAKAAQQAPAAAALAPSKAAAAPAAPAKPAAPKAGAPDPLSMADEDFLGLFANDNK